MTATEINNDYFTVERSLDAYTWKYVTKVDGKGNSTTTLEYETWDNQPYMGISYYRLKQPDFDGQFSYSDIVGVHLTESDEIRVLPNLASDKLTITGGLIKAQRLNIYDVIEQPYFSSILQKDIHCFLIDILDWEPGIYFINLTDMTRKVASKKIIKM